MLAITQRLLRLRQAGVTLVELVIVLAILGVLAVAAAPSVVDRWQRDTVILLAEQFASAASLAQTMAQYQHLQTNLVPLDTQKGWAGGWKLTTSPAASDPDRTISNPQEETTFSISPPITQAVRINWSAGAGLSYAPVGYSRRSNGGQLYGTLEISWGRHVRQVRINSVGRARICNPTTDGNSCKPMGVDAPDP
ncbi:hypothetical protein UB44_15260 [Burkholderiaceae bacterium 26]|nr:hypothetical protein UB44_15260 [Burkholderiaceae bacterium 26]